VNDNERLETLITGRLLAAGEPLGWLSMGLTLAAAVCLLVGTPWMPAVLGMVAAGLAGSYLVLRVGLDAKLFVDVSEGRLSTQALDEALAQLGLVSRGGKARSWTERCHSARWLLVRLAATVVLQCVLAAAAAWRA
jgi:hypothetical protein